MTVLNSGLPPPPASSGRVTGDVRLHTVPTGMSVETLFLDGLEEWLRTGYVVTYSGKYAALEQSPAGRRLYAYTVANELPNSGTGQVAARARAWWNSGTVYAFSPYAVAGDGRLAIKVALDSNVVTPTPSAVGGSTTLVYDVFMISTGANAGRMILTTNSGSANATIGYGTIAAVPVWTASANGSGGQLALLAGKPDGSLLLAMKTTVTSGVAGDFQTSVDAGATWVNRTPTGIGSSYYSRAIDWSPTLGKFLYIRTLIATGVSTMLSATDGYTYAAETGVPYAGLSGAYPQNIVADTGTAVVVVGASSTLLRSTGGAFSSVTTTRQLTSIVAVGTVLYATNTVNGIERSIDNGSNWVEIGQLNGPQPASPGVSIEPAIVAANGSLFYFAGSYFARFTVQPLPSLVPDSVGALTAVSTASGYPTGAAYFVRIK